MTKVGSAPEEEGSGRAPSEDAIEGGEAVEVVKNCMLGVAGCSSTELEDVDRAGESGELTGARLSPEPTKEACVLDEKACEVVVGFSRGDVQEQLAIRSRQKSEQTRKS